MIDMIKAIWFQESRILSRNFFAEVLGPISLGIIFFFVFSLPFRASLSKIEWDMFALQLIFHTSIFTFIFTTFIRVSSFYWRTQYGDSSFHLLILGGKGTNFNIFLAETLIALFFGSLYASITFFILVQFVSSISSHIHFPSVILFWVLIGFQFSAFGKIVGSVIKDQSGKWSVMFLGIMPVLLLSGIFMQNVPSVPINVEFILPFNLIYGITKGYILGQIEYSVLLYSMVETLFIVWVASSIIALKARK
jgi:hypothetical protein